MKKIVIIHYHPLELFPPVMNLLNYLNQDTDNVKIYVFTSQNITKLEQFNCSGIEIQRYPYPKKLDNRIIKGFKYVKFYFGTLLKLLKIKPNKILYYETNSALSVYYYLKFFVREVPDIYIHFHEYNTIEQYEKGMKLVKYIHKKEREYLFDTAKWISHTNHFRANLFANDIKIQPERINILPNYPPRIWEQPARENLKYPLSIIYIGSLSTYSTYLVEFCEWIMLQNGNILFDIYSHNFQNDASVYLKSINSEYIRFFERGVDYFLLPQKLKQYDIGIVFYKPVLPNIVYCASNKLFEYIICGLDVWLTKDMIGSYSYITHNTYPKIVKVDFSKMADFDLQNAISRNNHKFSSVLFNCEDALKEFKSVLYT